MILFISQPIFQTFFKIKGYFKAITIMYDVQLLLVFILKELNFKTCSVTFYFPEDVVS